MKIYRRLVLQWLDDGSFARVEEDSYEYKGPVALCGGGTSVSYKTPEASKEEKAYYAALTAKINEPAVQTENEKLLEEYTKQILQQEVANLPAQQEYQAASLDLLKQQIAYTSKQLQNLSDAQELGDITGELTQEQKDLFNQMETDAITTLTNSVNREQREVVDTAIADLVGRGVLQGSIGEKIISKIGTEATRLISEGTSSISQSKNAQELAAIESNANRQLQLRSLVQQGILSREQAAQNMALGGYAQSTQPFLTATQATQYAQGLSSQWQNQQLAGLQSTYANQLAFRGQQGTNALNAAISSSQANAQGSAGLMGGLGSLAGSGAIAAAIFAA